MSEVMAVPKLRFKEFDGDWESKKLGTFAKTFSGGTPTSSNKDYYNGDIPFIKSGEISCTCTEQFINQKGLDNFYSEYYLENEVKKRKKRNTTEKNKQEDVLFYQIKNKNSNFCLSIFEVHLI